MAATLEKNPDPALGEALLLRARNAIAERLGFPASSAADHPRLHLPGATFVTLTEHGELRGCIGSLEAWRPLAEDVAENAIAAAFHDPRFPPVRREEFPSLRIEVSLLSPPEAIHFRDEADAIRQLRPGIDGVIFACRGRRGTFLPQVWESLPEPAAFFAHLKQKAGFSPSFWSPEVQLYRYEVVKWKEPAKN